MDGDEAACVQVVSVVLESVDVTSALAEVARAVKACASSRRWCLGPPTTAFEERMEDDSGPAIEAQECCRLRIWGPGDSPALAADQDRASYEDVRALLDCLKVLAARDDLELRIEIDGECVGWVNPDGEDKLLKGGLMEPWRARTGA